MTRGSASDSTSLKQVHYPIHPFRKQENMNLRSGGILTHLMQTTYFQRNNTNITGNRSAVHVEVRLAGPLPAFISQKVSTLEESGV